MQRALLFFCLLISAGCTTTTPSVQRDPFDRTRPADCVPLPPTPNLATQTAYRLSPTLISITMTPLPTPHYIDLSSELPDEDKMVARVYRCDGTWDEYLLDPAIFPDVIALSNGDIIYDASPPASLMGRRPPEQITPTKFQMNNIAAETALPTPIPEQTLNAFHEGTPVATSEQAMVAALKFIGTSRLSYVNTPKAVSTELIPYLEAKKRTNESGVSHDPYSPDLSVWLVIFEGDFSLTDPMGTTFPLRHSCVFVIVDASDSSSIALGTITCGKLTEGYLLYPLLRFSSVSDNTRAEIMSSHTGTMIRVRY